eukprot:jgi/Mesen1/4194/ME000219S03319
MGSAESCAKEGGGKGEGEGQHLAEGHLAEGHLAEAKARTKRLADLMGGSGWERQAKERAKGQRAKRKARRKGARAREQGLLGPPGSRLSSCGWRFVADAGVAEANRCPLILRPGDPLQQAGLNTGPPCGTCEGSFNAKRLYIGCNQCGRWFHGEPFKVAPEDLARLATFRCFRCRKVANSWPSCSGPALAAMSGPDCPRRQTQPAAAAAAALVLEQDD